MRQGKVYRLIASSFEAYQNCIKTGNSEWEIRHKDTIEQLLDFLPSGSGWDHGTKLDYDRSTSEKLVFYGSYHHMNDGGYYDGWTEHTIIVRPSLVSGMSLHITGRNRNDIKEYLYQSFDYSLTEIVYYDDTDKCYRPISVQRAKADPFKDVPEPCKHTGGAHEPRKLPTGTFCAQCHIELA